MRKIIIGVTTVCGLVAAVAPALACPYTQASAEKASQQTASAQDTSITTAR